MLKFPKYADGVHISAYICILLHILNIFAYLTSFVFVAKLLVTPRTTNDPTRSRNLCLHLEIPLLLKICRNLQSFPAKRQTCAEQCFKREGPITRKCCKMRISRWDSWEHTQEISLASDVVEKPDEPSWSERQGSLPGLQQKRLHTVLRTRLPMRMLRTFSKPSRMYVLIACFCFQLLFNIYCMRCPIQRLLWYDFAYWTKLHILDKTAYCVCWCIYMFQDNFCPEDIPYNSLPTLSRDVLRVMLPDVELHEMSLHEGHEFKLLLDCDSD